MSSPHEWNYHDDRRPAESALRRQWATLGTQDLPGKLLWILNVRSDFSIRPTFLMGDVVLTGTLDGTLTLRIREEKGHALG